MAKRSRPSLTPVQRQLKRLIDDYREALQNQTRAQRVCNQAAVRAYERRLALSAFVRRNRIASYRAVFMRETAPNGTRTIRRIAAGKNLVAPGLQWGSEPGEPPDVHPEDGPQDCPECDAAMQQVADQPNWPGEQWCICTCGSEPNGGGLECFGETESPDDSEPE